MAQHDRVLHELFTHYNDVHSQVAEHVTPLIDIAQNYIQQHISPLFSSTIHTLNYHAAHIDPLLNSLISVAIISIVPFLTISAIVIVSKLTAGSNRSKALLSDNTLKVLVAFAVGCLLGDAFLHLIPHSLQPHSHSHSHADDVMQYREPHELLTTDHVLSKLQHHTNNLYDLTSDYTAKGYDLASQTYDLASYHGANAYSALTENGAAALDAVQYHAGNTIEAVKPHVNTVYETLGDQYNKLTTQQQSYHTTPEYDTSSHVNAQSEPVHDSTTVQRGNTVVHVEVDLHDADDEQLPAHTIRAPGRRLLQHMEIPNDPAILDQVNRHQQQYMEQQADSEQQYVPYVEPQIQVIPLPTDSTPSPINTHTHTHARVPIHVEVPILAQPVERDVYVEPQAQVVPLDKPAGNVVPIILPQTHKNTHTNRLHAVHNHDEAQKTQSSNNDDDTKHWQSTRPVAVQPQKVIEADSQHSHEHGHHEHDHQHNHHEADTLTHEHTADHQHEHHHESEQQTQVEQQQQQAVNKLSHTHDHDHSDHEHEHQTHDYAEHTHDHTQQGHDHQNNHVHDHSHSHKHAHGTNAHSHDDHDHGESMSVGLQILAGMLAFFLLEKLARLRSAGEHGHSHSHDHNTTQVSGLLNIIGDVSHNFTDGMAIAVSYSVSPALGVSTSLAVLIHEIPHEIGDLAILLQSGWKVSSAVYVQLLTATGALLGAYIGITASEYTSVSELLLPFTAGGFIYVALVNVLPALFDNTSIKQTIYETAALIAGVMLMYVIGLYE